MGREERGDQERKAALEEEETKVDVEVGQKVAVARGDGYHSHKDEDEHGVDAEEDEDDGDHGGAEDEGEEEEVKWAKHYSSAQEILLVGEGDFSFSLSLATSFGSASNIVSTSLDSRSKVTRKYDMAKSNLEHLEKMGATLLHGIDATKMKLRTDLKMRKFDRIIFNFPHAGFKGKEDDMRLINLHKQLVYGFFRNASRMLRQDGEVHISHKTSFPFWQWKLEELASVNSLVLFKSADFRIEDYPGYKNKRGDGSRCDQPFPLGECSTFMFRIGKSLRRKQPAADVANLCGMVCSATLPENSLNCVPIASDAYLLSGTQRPSNFSPNHYGMSSSVGLPERNPNCLHIASDGSPFLNTEGHLNTEPNLCRTLPSVALPIRNPNFVPVASDGYVLHGTERPPPASYMRYVNGWPNVEGFPERLFLHSRPQQLGYVTDLEDRRGSPRMGTNRLCGRSPQNASISPEFISVVEGSLRKDFEVYMNQTPGNTIQGYVAYLQELHHLSIQRTAWLRRMLLLRQAP